jgi:hypothetical protein
MNLHMRNDVIRLYDWRTEILKMNSINLCHIGKNGSSRAKTDRLSPISRRVEFSAGTQPKFFQISLVLGGLEP